MRMISIAATALALVTTDTMAADKQQRIYADPTTGCKVYGNINSVTYIKWNGKCVNGLAHGPGTVTYYGKNNRVIWWTNTGPKQGIEFINGLPVIQDANRQIVAVHFIDPSCRKRRGLQIGPPRRATARVFVTTFAEIEHFQLRQTIHRIAYNRISQHCGGHPRLRPRIHIYRPARSIEEDGHNFFGEPAPLGWALVGHAVIHVRHGQPLRIQQQGTNAAHQRRQQMIRKANGVAAR